MEEQQTARISPWKAIEYFFLITVILFGLGTGGYFISYFLTYQSQGEGTSLSNLKNDILLEQESSSIESQLSELGYKPEKLIPLNTHRSTRYYADVLEGFSPTEQKGGDRESSFLFQDENGEYYHLKKDAQNNIVGITPLRQ